MGSRNNAQSKADKDIKAHKDAVANIQAKEAKEVQPRAGGIEAAFKDNYKKTQDQNIAANLLTLWLMLILINHV